MGTADAISMAREEAIRVFDVNHHLPNSRAYWQHRAKVAEYILQRVTEGVAAVEQLSQAASAFKDAQEFKAGLAQDMLQSAEHWDAHINSIVGLSGDAATLIKNMCKNDYNAYAYHRYRRKLSHDDSLAAAEEHHAKRRRGLSFILGTCSRWQNKDELPFLQLALGVEMFSIATPVKSWDLFTALRAIPSYKTVSRFVDVLCATHMAQWEVEAKSESESDKPSLLQQTSYDNHEYNIKLAYQRTNADSKFLHTVNSTHYHLLEQEFPVDPQELDDNGGPLMQDRVDPSWKFDTSRALFRAQRDSMWHTMLDFVSCGQSLFNYPVDPAPVTASKVNILRPIVDIDTASYADNIFVADFIMAQVGSRYPKVRVIHNTGDWQTFERQVGMKNNDPHTYANFVPSLGKWHFLVHKAQADFLVGWWELLLEPCAMELGCTGQSGWNSVKREWTVKEFNHHDAFLLKVIEAGTRYFLELHGGESGKLMDVEGVLDQIHENWGAQVLWRWVWPPFVSPWLKSESQLKVLTLC